MNASWILLAVAAAVVAAMIATSWLRRDRGYDLGSVSHQWIAEQRLGGGHESQR